MHQDKDFDFGFEDSSDEEPIVDDLEEKVKQIQDYLLNEQQTNPIVLKKAETKHLIFVGKARNGKSTALEVLKTPFHFVTPSTLFAVTEDAEINHFTVEVEGKSKSKMNFNISIIDTPGLFEVKDIGTARDNEALEAIVLKCMNAEITKIHAIFFVISQSGSGVNPQDIEALGSFINLFGGAEKNVYLLITRGEDLSRKEKAKLKSELYNYPGMKEKLSTINSDVLFTGACSQGDIDRGFVDGFKFRMDNVIRMRKKLFSRIFALNDPFDLHALTLADDVRVKARKLHGDLKEKVKDKASITNPSMFKASVRKLSNWSNFLSQEERKTIRQFCDELSKFIEAIEYSAILERDMTKFEGDYVTLERKANEFDKMLQYLDEGRAAKGKKTVEECRKLIANAENKT